jgi:hypothetical protein
MVSKLDKLDVRSPIEALLPVFDRGHVAIVMDGASFFGLITPDRPASTGKKTKFVYLFQSAGS